MPLNLFRVKCKSHVSYTRSVIRRVVSGSCESQTCCVPSIRERVTLILMPSFPGTATPSLPGVRVRGHRVGGAMACLYAIFRARAQLLARWHNNPRNRQEHAASSQARPAAPLSGALALHLRGLAMWGKVIRNSIALMAVKHDRQLSFRPVAGLVKLCIFNSPMQPPK